MKNEKFKPITIIVTACGNIRAFTTQRFTIRAFCLHLQRYGVNQHIMMMFEGALPDKLPINSREWTCPTDAELAGMTLRIATERKIIWSDFDEDLSKEELLRKIPSYRHAINTLYCQRFNHGEYPQEAPFNGIKVTGQPNRYKTLQRPVFLRDEDNREAEYADVLKWYDGYRVRRLVNGIEVSGYILKNSRF